MMKTYERLKNKLQAVLTVHYGPLESNKEPRLREDASVRVTVNEKQKSKTDEVVACRTVCNLHSRMSIGDSSIRRGNINEKTNSFTIIAHMDT